MNTPTHFAYVITEPKEGSDKKAFWHRVGTVWPHKTGTGFDIVIPDGNQRHRTDRYHGAERAFR